MTKQKYNIDDLREDLADTIRKVKSGEMDLDKAKVVCELGRVVVESAKAEVGFLDAIGGHGSDFLNTKTQTNNSKQLGDSGVLKL